MGDQMTSTTIATAAGGATAPLADTLEGLSRFGGGLTIRLGAPSGEGWLPATRLSEPDSPALRDLLARVAAAYQTDDRSVVGSFFMGGYTWILASVGLGAYLLAGRVPDLAPEHVSLRFGEGAQITGIAFASPRFWALADDRVADHPDAAVVADRAALLECFRLGYERHCERLIPALRASSGLGARMLRLTAADRCASFLVWVNQQQAVMPFDQLAAEIDALVRAPGSPLANRFTAACRTADGDLTLQRGACCLNYKRDEGELCDSCPLLRKGRGATL